MQLCNHCTHNSQLMWLFQSGWCVSNMRRFAINHRRSEPIPRALASMQFDLLDTNIKNYVLVTTVILTQRNSTTSQTRSTIIAILLHTCISHIDVQIETATQCKQMIIIYKKPKQQSSSRIANMHNYACSYTNWLPCETWT